MKVFDNTKAGELEILLQLACVKLAVNVSKGAGPHNTNRRGVEICVPKWPDYVMKGWEGNPSIWEGRKAAIESQNLELSQKGRAVW